MNKIITLAIALILTVIPCQSKEKFQTTKKTFSVGGFTGIVASGGGFELILKQDKKEDIVLDVSENWRNCFTVEVKNEVLYITMTNAQGSGKAVFNISAPEITNITSSDLCEIKVGAFNTKSPCHITCKGSSDIEIDKLTTKSLDVKIFGLGEVDLNAVNCKEDIVLKVEGSGDFSASKLECRSLDGEVQGLGEIDLGSAICKGDTKFLIQGSGEASVDKLTCNALDNNVSGLGSINIDVANGTTIKNQIKGSGSVKLKGLSGGRITGDIEGLSSLTLAGSCEELKGNGVGSSSLNIKSLKSKSPITFATKGLSEIVQ